MKKKLLSMLLAGVMGFSIASCGPGGGGEAATDGGGTTRAADSNGGNSGNDANEQSAPEPSELVVEVFSRDNVGGTDPANNFYTDWIKEKVLADLNISVTFKAVDRFTEQERMVELLAGGTAPDVCYSYNDNGMIQTFGDQGGITDLAPYIDSMRGELNDLFDFLGEDLIYRARDPEDGHLYNIYARRMTEARTIPWIRKDWLDALDLPLPTTTDEFVDALRKFKSEDPGNVGNVIPLAMTRDVRNRASTLLESFIEPNLSRKDLYVNYVASQFILFPGIKEGARLLNTMYNEGLIDPDHVVYPDDEDSDNLVKQGVVGAMIHNWDYPMRDVPGIMKALKENVPGAEFVPVDCFTNANGVTWKVAFDAQGILLFVPAQSKNPEGALRYWNWMCKLENRKFLQIGEEGVTHVLDEYGVPSVVDVEGEKIMNSGMNIDYTMVINGLDLGDNEANGIAMGSLYPSVTPDLVGKAYEVAMANSIKMPVVSVPGGLAYENSVMQTLTEKQSAIYNTAIDAPPEEFDAVWDAGIADYLLTAQQAIDDREAGYHE